MSENNNFESFNSELPSPQGSGLSRRTLLMGGAILGVAALGGGTWLLNQGGEDHPPTPATTEPRPMQPSGATTQPCTASESKINWPRLGDEFKSEPTWGQDFTTQCDGPLDRSVWTPDTDYRQPPKIQSRAAYTDAEANVRVEGGNLILQALKQQAPYAYPNDPNKKPYDYTSARIDTKGEFSMRYGLLEASIQMPSGSGTWPAFWLVPENRETTRPLGQAGKNSERAYNRGGEIDIVEYYGIRPGKSDGVMHTVEKMSKGEVRGDFEDRFNTFGISLTPDKLSFLLNGSVYCELVPTAPTPEAWPFTEADNNRLYPILNLAMGGSGGKEIDDRSGPWTMKVQGLRYHELAA